MTDARQKKAASKLTKVMTALIVLIAFYFFYTGFSFGDPDNVVQQSYKPILLAFTIPAGAITLFVAWRVWVSGTRE
jgi:hypothetical protein